jgi:hypothetical protein
MHINVYDIFYSQFSHQHVSPANVTFFGVILLQEYKRTKVTSCVVVVVAPQQLKFILISVKII